MTKRWIPLLVAICGATSMMAQTAPVQTPQNLAGPGSINTNELGIGGLTFTNRTGQTFSPDELASQLQNLRSAIDQALPVLSAFNENYSNSVSGGKQTIGGTLSGIVSDVLHRNQGASQNATANQSSLGATNLLAILHNLLNTNSSNGAVGAAPGTSQDLVALQNGLQPVATILQRLTLSSGSSLPTTPLSNGSTAQPYNGNLTPTGR